jgi:hypothetical protein
MFDSTAKDITFGMRMANQMKESAARARIYEGMAREARALTEAYNRAQENITANAR